MVTEDYVSFETAKLLKEKGFNGLCTAYYDCFTTDNFHCGYEPTDFNSIDPKIRNIVAAPTLQMAIKWLKEEHNLGVIPHWSQVSGEFSCRIYDLTKKGSQEYHSIRGSFDGFEESAELGIKYCLEKLV